ncbi:hypothetical protein NT05HA_0578 [Aggregatibacter aphrophilus NJ8700]|nr:hypothetical protein NT05HA_0578 [Aggregatibacter aphrophilus NJ8700]
MSFLVQSAVKNKVVFLYFGCYSLLFFALFFVNFLLTNITTGGSHDKNRIN